MKCKVNPKFTQEILLVEKWTNHTLKTPQQTLKNSYLLFVWSEMRKM